MMAALTAARVFGCSRRAVEAVLSRFEGLEHRLEFVQEIEGVRYYDDSKGTNVGSVVKSLQSFSEPVVLIAGGKDKQGDLSPLKDLVRNRVKRLILIGEAKERMARELGTLTDTAMAPSLEEAVLMAHRTAKKGDVVLLPPVPVMTCSGTTKRGARSSRKRSDGPETLHETKREIRLYSINPGPRPRGFWNCHGLQHDGDYRR